MAMAYLQPPEMPVAMKEVNKPEMTAEGNVAADALTVGRSIRIKSR